MESSTLYLTPTCPLPLPPKPCPSLYCRYHQQSRKLFLASHRHHHHNHYCHRHHPHYSLHQPPLPPPPARIPLHRPVNRRESPVPLPGHCAQESCRLSAKGFLRPPFMHTEAAQRLHQAERAHLLLAPLPPPSSFVFPISRYLFPAVTRCLPL